MTGCTVYPIYKLYTVLYNTNKYDIQGLVSLQLFGRWCKYFKAWVKGWLNREEYTTFPFQKFMLRKIYTKNVQGFLTWNKIF